MSLDWKLLLRALEHTGDGQYGCDRDSGAIRFFHAHELDSDDPREQWDLERFLMIEPLPPWCCQSWVLDFAEQEQDELRRQLVQAADDERPLPAVRRVLGERGPARERWDAFYQRALEHEAESWAASAGFGGAPAPPWREPGDA